LIVTANFQWLVQGISIAASSTVIRLGRDQLIVEGSGLPCRQTLDERQGCLIDPIGRRFEYPIP
jgi:hypothetical protein